MKSINYIFVVIIKLFALPLAHATPCTNLYILEVLFLVVLNLLFPKVNSNLTLDF